MACVDVAIIGGTGIGERLSEFAGRPLHVPTEAGLMRGRLIAMQGLQILLVNRHSIGHSVPPNRVNYEAIARGIKATGARACLSTAAVGSLRPEWGPGRFIVCSDFLDFTGRNLSLFDRSVVHRDFTRPFGTDARSALLAAGRELAHPIEDGGVYLSTNGPRYETPQEIKVFRSLGADVAGMTAATEAILFREAEVSYACLAIVTNLASGISKTPLDHAEVVEEMGRAGEVAVHLLLHAARLLGTAR